MVQTVIVTLIFAAAVFYTGRLIVNVFRKKDGCASGCGKCAAVDLNTIEKQLKEKGF